MHTFVYMLFKKYGLTLHPKSKQYEYEAMYSYTDNTCYNYLCFFIPELM